MSDGMSEVFRRKNQELPKTTMVNTHVELRVFKDRILLINHLSKDQIGLKKTTLKKIAKLISKKTK